MNLYMYVFSCKTCFVCQRASNNNSNTDKLLINPNCLLFLFKLMTAKKLMRQHASKCQIANRVVHMSILYILIKMY